MNGWPKRHRAVRYGRLRCLSVTGTMRKTVMVALLALFGGPTLADEPHPLFPAGLEAYEFFCLKCHGKDMVNPGVSSFDLRKFPVDQKERFYDSVLNGRGDMPAWGDVIYPEEMDALWVYVATRGGTQPFPGEEQSRLPPDLDNLIQPGKLTACLSRNAGAISGRRDLGGTGFDYRVSKSLSEFLGLELDVVWFENEAGEESDPVHETYAMLSYGLCDIVPSHPLYARSVGDPPTVKAALPRWLGMPEEIDAETQRRVHAQLPHVTLKPISITQAYMRAEIGLVYPAGEAEPDSLESLSGLRVAFQQGTLSGALLELDAPDLIENAVTLNPGPGFLWKLEAGAADVAIVDVASFDAHRRHNEVTKLRLANWRHRVGLDIGIAVLKENANLLSALDEGLSDLHNAKVLPGLAEEEGLTYVEPHFDGLQAPFTWHTLRRTN